MHKLAIGLVAASLFAAPAFAQTPLTFADVDGNSDGRLSFEELALVWPDLTQEEFAGADVEGLGLTPEQLNTLQPPAVPAPGADPAPADALPAN